MLAIDDFVGPAAEVETLVEPVLGALIDGLALRPRALPAGIWIAPRVCKNNFRISRCLYHLGLQLTLKLQI